MEMTLPPREKLTYDELVKILADQQVWIERTEERVQKLEDLIVTFWDAVKEQDKFITFELLKTEAELYGANKKTPYRKLLELEKQVMGFIAHHEKNPHFEKKVKISKYD